MPTQRLFCYNLTVFSLFASLPVALFAALAYALPDSLGTIGEINEFIGLTATGRVPFRVSGTVLRGTDIAASHGQIILDDNGQRATFFTPAVAALQRGDQIVAKGVVRKSRIDVSVAANCCIDSYEITSNRFLQLPFVPLHRLDEQSNHLQPLVTEGTVTDIFPDEIDPRYTILLLKDGPVILPAFLRGGANTIQRSTRLRINGVYHKTVSGYRSFSGPFIEISDISETEPPPVDVFTLPDLEWLSFRSHTEVAALDRRIVSGTVLARWDGYRLMVRDKIGRVINVTLNATVGLPECGECVTVSGWPETDLFRINLTHADWRREIGRSPAEEIAEDIQPEDVLRDSDSHRHFSSVYHGRLVRLQGIIRNLPNDIAGEQLAYIDVNGHLVAINTGMCKLPRTVTVGCLVSVTGRCLLESEVLSRINVFPRIKRFIIILRSPSDVVVLSRPSWWTQTRLCAVIALLLVVVIGFVVWNRLLGRLVERRGKELYRSEINRMSSELKVGERTRLAVELHDTLSQNLTGIALAINAGEYELARTSLKSCRDELKNCLWDLRNNALEVADMNEAIRLTLAPHIGKAKLIVRFNLPRNHLTDKTTHAILRIVRELAVNAMRHGGATEIRIAGSAEDRRILFSVHDNGCGFDTNRIPGIAEGHFGLQGIRDRVKSMSGEMKITSSPDGGTKVTLWIKSKC